MLRTDSNYFENLIKNDPGFSLLRANSASLVISFFYQEFIVYNKLSVLAADMEIHLDSFLRDHKEELKEFEAENTDESVEDEFLEKKDRKQRVRGYIEKWCKNGLCVDEIFAQTIIANYIGMDKVYSPENEYKSCMRECPWHEKDEAHKENFYRYGDDNLLINSDKLFALKFGGKEGLDLIDSIRTNRKC